MKKKKAITIPSPGIVVLSIRTVCLRNLFVKAQMSKPNSEAAISGNQVAKFQTPIEARTTSFRTGMISGQRKG